MVNMSGIKKNMIHYQEKVYMVFIRLFPVTGSNNLVKRWCTVTRMWLDVNMFLHPFSPSLRLRP